MDDESSVAGDVGFFRKKYCLWGKVGVFLFDFLENFI